MLNRLYDIIEEHESYLPDEALDELEKPSGAERAVCGRLCRSFTCSCISSNDKLANLGIQCISGTTQVKISNGI